MIKINIVLQYLKIYFIIFYFVCCCLRLATCYEYFYVQKKESSKMSKSSVSNDLSITLCPDEAMLYVLDEEFMIDDHKNQDQKSYSENNKEHPQTDEICVARYAVFSSQLQSESRSRSRSYLN